MKYVAMTLVLGLVALALYGVISGGDTEQKDRSGQDGQKKRMTVEGDHPGGGNGPGNPAGTGTTGPIDPETTAAGDGSKEPTRVDTVDPGEDVTANTNPNGGTAANAGKQEQPAKPPVPRPNVIKDDIVADVVYGVLRDLVVGNATSNDRAMLESRLEAMLEQEKMGSKELREQAVVTTVSTMLRQAGQYEARGGGLTQFQQLAIKALANEFAGDLYRRLPVAGQAGGHEGTLRAAVEVEVPAGYERAKWEVLGGFEYEEGMELPKTVAALNNKKVGIAGYMMTLEEVEDIHEFLLVESLWSCCFGTPPEVHQVIVVTMEEGKPGIDYTTAPVLVLGKMEVGEEVEDGFVTSLYRLTASEVKEVQ